MVAFLFGWSGLTFVWASALALVIAISVVDVLNLASRRSEEHLVGVLIVSVIVLLATSLFGFMGWTDRNGCEQRAVEVEATDWKNGYWTGCRVEIDDNGRYVDIEAVVVTERRSGG